MNKSEIQARIEKCESELASLKAELTKCEDGIEQERCWHGVSDSSGVHTVYARTKQEAANYSTCCRPAYMPECRQVTEHDFDRAFFHGCRYAGCSSKEFAEKLHDLGFRMKVKP